MGGYYSLGQRDGGLMTSRRRKTKDIPFAALGPQLENLRLRRGVSQVELAAAMGMGQSALSHMERRADVLVSTLAEYVESLGGVLTIEAKFRDGESVALMEGGRAPAAADMSGLVETDRQMALPA